MTTREQLIKALREKAHQLSGRLNETVPLINAAADMLEADGVPVASIYITPGGDREFDDWKCELPVGRNELYTAPQPAIQERKPMTDEHVKTLFLGLKRLEISSRFSDENWFLAGVMASESANGIKENKP